MTGWEWWFAFTAMGVVSFCLGFAVCGLVFSVREARR